MAKTIPALDALKALYDGRAGLTGGPLQLLTALILRADTKWHDPYEPSSFSMTLKDLARLALTSPASADRWRRDLRRRGFLQFEDAVGRRAATCYTFQVGRHWAEPAPSLVSQSDETRAPIHPKPAQTLVSQSDETFTQSEETNVQIEETNVQIEETSKENARASLSSPSTPDRVDRARGIGRRNLPNPYPLDIPDAVRDRSARLAAWAAGPPLHIANGAKSPKWLDACAEFERLGIPDDDIKGFITRRTAETHREAASRGETAEPIHSLAYHAVALTQWAQTYDPATTAPVSGKPKRDRGFLSDADTDAEQIAGALAWRQRNAKDADTDPTESG